MARWTNRGIARWAARVAVGLVVLLLGLALLAWFAARRSLPMLDGELALSGLSAPVALQRDALGVVTIDAANEADAMRALGYVHAQERYFEMDLMRRTAAGELAELFGPVALDTDKQHRVHRMRARVMQDLDAILGDKRRVAQAYVDGVNAGLASLEARPWPYLLLRAEPQPWLLADSALTGYAMYFDLQESTHARELVLWKIKPHLPPALYALLTHDGSSWDAPLTGAARGDARLPTIGELDLRKLPAPDDGELVDLAMTALPDRPEVGSNNFAVSGALTADGRAIVADDMHLKLRAPNIWFRARLRYADARASGGKVDVAGFTLPGLPAMVVGNNGHVAWGFTNSYVRSAAFVRYPPCIGSGQNAKMHATPGCMEPRGATEVIRVAGHAPVEFGIDTTAWGPVVSEDPDGSRYALKWVAHGKGSLNLALMDLAHAANSEQALAVARRARMPAQNLIVGDGAGRIAWGLIGAPLSARFCSDKAWGALPLFPVGDAGVPPVEEACTWVAGRGWAPGTGVDSISSDRLWTANSRVLDGPVLQQLGDGGYVLGARAQQIRADLFADRSFTERDLLAIQLDDRALFLARWWTLLRAEAARAGTPAALGALAEAAQRWEGHASIDSVSYRIVRAWRLAVHARIADGLTAPAQAALRADFEMPALPQLEGVVWPMVTQQPVHLLSRRFTSWDALFEDAAREVRDELERQGPLAQRTWGERNTAAICHPLAGAIPLFGKRLLCMPADPLAGDSHMPRVVGPAFGASERMVVSPGHEADGIVHMPGGQAGHPMSPFWGAGHDDWVHGRPTPFLPGPTQHTLRLNPAD